MKRIIAFMLLIALQSAYGEQRDILTERNKYDSAMEATKPITDAIGDEVQSFAEAFVRNTISFGGKPVEQRRLEKDKKILQVTRSVKDCIKPGGLIDDDVQMCVNGTREKKW